MLKHFGSLHGKIRLLLLLFILVPILIMALFSYSMMLTSIRRNAEVFTQQLGKQILQNLENYLNEIERLTVYPFSDEKLMDFLVRNSDGAGEVDIPSSKDRSDITLTLSSPFYYGSEIRGVFLFTNNGYSLSNLPASDYHSQNDPFFWDEFSVGNRLIAPHAPRYYINSDIEVFSVVRTIRELYTTRVIGMLKVDILPKAFDKILAEIDLTENTFISIYDKDAKIYYESSDTPDIHSEDQGIEVIHQSHDSGLLIRTLIPLSDLNAEALILVRSYLVLFLIFLLISFLIDRLMVRMISGPVEKIKNGMLEVQTGNYHVSLPIKRSDEIGDIARSFNDMVFHLNRSIEEIKSLNSEIYRIKLHERNLELSVLQKQINPHFLYNSLELVNMIAMDKDLFEISDLVTALGDLFRYSTRNEIQFVRLEDEIDFVHAYTLIIKRRLDDRIQFLFEIPEEYYPLKIPKLIIQPLVENAVKHGLEESRGTVKLSVWDQGDDLMIAVYDNGLGFDPYRFESFINQDWELGQGDALRNVHQRIAMQYGIEYGLAIDRTVSKGTRITIRLPKDITVSQRRSPL